MTDHQPPLERTVFNFHGIGVPHAGVPADEAPYWCPTDLFMHLADAMADLLREGRSIEITFDDGNRSDLDIAAPILADRGLSATFFACSGRLDDPRYLDGAGLRSLEVMGMVVGSHGRNHVDLRRADAATLRQETSGSQQTLSEALGRPVDRFAIPFGSYDRRVLGALKTYTRIYNSDQTRAGPQNQRFVPRISYTTGWTKETVQQRVAERYSYVRQQKQNLKSTLKRLR
ncbi:polysaccharide deacetylase family protein [Phenylobacterium sp.]|uniref:polysaccharide deacetylase family protein n=1 Tax=Phenylobacterium sp. TaxID=1871053 RepID=UPI00301D9A8F